MMLTTAQGTGPCPRQNGLAGKPAVSWLGGLALRELLVVAERVCPRLTSPRNRNMSRVR